MFYYMKMRPKKITFTVFDRFLRSFEFNSVSIEDNADEYPDEYALYQKFYKKIYSE
jgi:hypothetical protein